jgi:hypothetical protein
MVNHIPPPVAGILNNFYTTSIPVFPKIIFAREPLLASKNTTGPHILAGVNVECPDDR